MNNETKQPLAVVRGEKITEVPTALYIPPAALHVMLSEFEGPLDLLLFLVRKHKFDILDIPMTQLCRQYTAYVEDILHDDLELAADYLNMSALLVEIKTKMLLPRPPSEEEDEADPRADLVRRLLEYERIRKVAEELGALPRRERDFISPHIHTELPRTESKPSIQPGQLAAVYAEVMRRAKNTLPLLLVERETLTVREVMSNVLRRLKSNLRLTFQAMCQPRQGGVTFLALLQLALERMVHLQQTEDDDLSIQLRDDPS